MPDFPIPPHRLQRALDLAVALPLALVTLPLVMALAVGSALSFRAWPLFHQPRLGRDGDEFRFTKIRSLPAQAPAAADKYALQEVENTRFGLFLRRSKLDELPQLWLVVTGRMSLVGPRPEMPSLAYTFDRNFVVTRCRVRPGVTGLWQISPASAGLIGEAPEYDLTYLANRSLRLDVWLLARTARQVLLSGDGTDLDDLPPWCSHGTSPTFAVASS